MISPFARWSLSGTGGGALERQHLAGIVRGCDLSVSPDDYLRDYTMCRGGISQLEHIRSIDIGNAGCSRTPRRAHRVDLGLGAVG
jgi:hypothetical protein